MFRAQAQEDFEMKNWVGELRKMQEELHATGTMISDEDFIYILLTSLPDSWDMYTMSYLGAMGNKPMVKSHELIAILIAEFARRKGKVDAANIGATMQTRNIRDGRDRKQRKIVECFNCKRKGHTKDDCYWRGGGKEGQQPWKKGPKRGQTNQSKDDDNDINLSLNDLAYITCAAVGQDFGKRDWIFDSVTTSHICPNRDDFKEYKPIDGTISGIGNSPVRVIGRGTVVLIFDVNGKSIPHTLSDVLHVPDAANCLVSVSRHDAAGHTAEFCDSGCTLKDKSGRVVGKGQLKNRLYLLFARVNNTNCVSLQGSETRGQTNQVSNDKASWEEWHKRYGHISATAIQQLSCCDMVTGLSVDHSTPVNYDCSACIQAKQARRPFPKEAQNRSNKPGDRTMTDVWGPARTKSVGRWSYYISFTDDCTRTCTVLFLRTKDEAFDKIKQHILLIERKFNRKPRFLQLDNGKELVNEKLKTWVAENGITLEPMAPHSPSQNSIAECFNRMLLELARAMLFVKNLPTFLWDEAIAHMVYLQN